MLRFVLEEPDGTYVMTAAPKAVSVTTLMNGVSTAQLTFDEDDKFVSVCDDGFRVRVLWRVGGGDPDIQLMAGPWDEIRRTDDGDVVFTFADDFLYLTNLGWPKPSAAITAQDVAYKRYSGKLETAVKGACTDLSTRLGSGWTMASDKELGPNVRVEVRFSELTDNFVDLLNAAGLMWTLVDGVVDVTEGALFPSTLTERSGVLESWEWKLSAPTATRVVVGGEGEGADRVLREYVDSALEAVWGPREVFKDARMAKGVTDLSPDGEAALAEGAPRVQFNATLNETPLFFFPKYRLGDRVHVRVGKVDETVPITRIEFEDGDDGLTVTPVLGWADEAEDDELYRAVLALRAAARDQRSTQ